MAGAQDDDFGPPPLSLRESRLGVNRELKPWTWRLAVFLRVLAAVELIKGLVYWIVLVGAGGPAEPLVGRSAGWFVSTIFFAVSDPVAAVGLWVGAGWGVAIWLIAAVGQLAVIAFGGHVAGGWAIVAATLLAMSAYAALSLKARAEVS